MNSGPTARKVFRFGVYQVDTRSGELFKHGIRIRIQDQPFQVLLVLLEKQGEVVTREELRERLWSAQTFVDFDHSLTIAVNKLRDALNDAPDNPRFVETLPRRGYRFLVPVTVEAEEAGKVATPEAATPRPAPPPSSPRLETEEREGRASPEAAPWARHRMKLALLASGVVIVAGGWLWQNYRKHETAEPPSKLMLAVLPFESLSSESGEDYFLSGLHDEMISQLGRMHSSRLGVIARTSVLQYKNTRKPIQQIGRELHVDYVLEGTVRRAADRVRINVQLVKASDQTQLWSEQFERMAADVIAIQVDVARRVADSLALELLPDERNSMERAATANMGAYEDYLRGRYHWNQRTEEGFLKAIVYFEDAARKDPAFALAYAGLADCYNLMGGYAFQSPAQAYPKAKAAAAKALELNGNLAEAHAAMAFAHFYFDWDWKGAEQSFQRALAANPNHAPSRQWYAEFLHAMGRLDEAEGQFRRALELDPFSLPLNDDLGWLQLSRKRNEEAIEQFRKAQSLDPSWASAHSSLAFALARAGRYPQALTELENLKRISGETTGYLETLGYVHAVSGQKDAARRILKTLRDRSRGTHVSPYSLALIHLGMGVKDQAFAELQRGLQQHEAWMPWLKVHPEWDSLRQEPRFQEMIKQLGL